MGAPTDETQDPNQSYCFAQRSSSRTTNEGTISDLNTPLLVQALSETGQTANIPLNEHFFSAVNWGRALDSLKSRGEDCRNILGARVVESDLLWRYFVRES